MQMMRPFFISIAVILGFALTSVCRGIAAEHEAVNGIAAIVNGDIITYSQVRELVEPRERMLRAQLTGDELVKQIKEARLAALKDLIDRQLIIQFFQKEGYQIPDHFVDEEIKTVIRESFGGDRNTFIKTLQAQNFTLGEFKKMEKEKMMVQAMRGQKAKPTTVIPPGKIDEYYKQHRDQFSSKEEVHLRMIMIPGSDSSGASSASQKALAEEILGKLVHGAEFDGMARIYSEDSTRDLGGDWGWVERKTLAPPLEQVVFGLPTGKVSNIVQLGGNYYILKVEERRGGESRPLEQVRAEIQKKLEQEEAQRVQERWLASLRQKAYIKTF
jgi:parvulin-like peptidyl-prolyl isomerase